MTLKELTEMDDLISRWEAFKAVMDDENITNAMDSANDGEMHRTKRAASRIIAGLPSAQQWIPCSERLPEDSSPVLITHRGGVSYGWYNGRYFERGASTNHRKLQTVIAWMPLPKPYGVKQ